MLNWRLGLACRPQEDAQRYAIGLAGGLEFFYLELMQAGFGTPGLHFTGFETEPSVGMISMQNLKIMGGEVHHQQQSSRAQGPGGFAHRSQKRQAQEKLDQQ